MIKSKHYKAGYMYITGRVPNISGYTILSIKVSLVYPLPCGRFISFWSVCQSIVLLIILFWALKSWTSGFQLGIFKGWFRIINKHRKPITILLCWTFSHKLMQTWRGSNFYLFIYSLLDSNCLYTYRLLQ